MPIPLGDAATLGAVRGLTEVLPVSGGAHEALFHLLFGGEPDFALTAVMHGSVAVAALALLGKRAWSALDEGLRGLAHPALLRETPGGRDALFVTVTSLLSAVVAFVADRACEGSRYAGSPYALGAGLLVTALVLASTRFAPRGTATPGLSAAVVIGIAQGAAVAPGMSRTGLTMASLVWMGVAEERAFELSFLAAIPALGVAAIVAGTRARFVGESVASLGVSAVVAFAAASVALRGLRALSASAKNHWFAAYLAPLGLATLAWGYARP